MQIQRQANVKGNAAKGVGFHEVNGIDVGGLSKSLPKLEK
jgi:hypothetical protein